MIRRRWVAGYRFAFAALALVAIAYQFWYLAEKPNFRPADFFSFFTIESNLFAAAVLLWGVRQTSKTRSPETVALVRGAALLYLSITGVVYGLLLSGYQQELQLTVPWVDTVLHRIMPLVMVGDWFLLQPPVRIEPRRALLWLAYPLIYVAYSLLRGHLVNWYPYPFLNPHLAGGYGVVALYCIAIGIGTALFCWVVAVSSRRFTVPARAAT